MACHTTGEMSGGIRFAGEVDGSGMPSLPAVQADREQKQNLLPLASTA
jgi:hypothetical protein